MEERQVKPKLEFLISRPRRKMVTVLLLDFGDTLSLPYTKLRALNAAFMDVPSLVAPMALYGVYFYSTHYYYYCHQYCCLMLPQGIIAITTSLIGTDAIYIDCWDEEEKRLFEETMRTQREKLAIVLIPGTATSIQEVI